LFLFVVTAVGLTLTGVLAPGPITAATLASGTRNRHAGALIALGHIAVEFPAILVLVAGLGTLVESSVAVRSCIALAGGAFLLLMGVQLLQSLRQSSEGSDAATERHPFWTGVVLTGTSPYFWVWAATVGLTLTNQALEFGLLTLVLFALAHWTCDLGWLEVLSLAGYKGSQVFGEKSQRWVSLVCGVMLVAFGQRFFYDAGSGLYGLLAL
jgi:threonine/homoserine/homoserine lactone efflux protein